MEPDLTRRPRTKRPFTDADMIRMRDLYYDRDVPMIAVADAFGVPVSTFLRWTAEMSWPRRSSSGPGNRAVYDYGSAQEATPANAPPPALRATCPDFDVAVGQPNRQQPVCGAKHCQRSAGEDQPVPMPPSDADLLAAVRDAARRDLAALGELAGPVDPRAGLHARKRRADIIESLSRSIARLDRVSEARDEQRALQARVTELEAAANEQEREQAALARKLRRSERELADALCQLAKHTALQAAAAATPKPVRPGQLTRPEFQQWWINRGEEPP